MADAAKNDDAEHCINIVRENANDLYLADLLLAESIRSDIFILHAFHVEVGNILLSVREPVIGEIRLQWWREIIDGQRNDEAQGHPVARALLSVIERYNLPKSAFEQKLQAHQFDLYHDPMASREMLEGYCGEVRSILFQLSGIIAGATDIKKLAQVSGHAGVATGLVWVLETMAHHRMEGRIYAPAELLDAVGLDSQGFSVGKLTSAHEQLAMALVDLAEEHDEKFKTALKGLPNTVKPVFNQCALVKLYLKRIRRNPGTVFENKAPISQLKRQWALFMF